MKIIKHGDSSIFTFRGKCTFCGCEFETEVVRNRGNDFACEEGVDILAHGERHGFAVPYCVHSVCPECSYRPVHMERVEE